MKPIKTHNITDFNFNKQKETTFSNQGLISLLSPLQLIGLSKWMWRSSLSVWTGCLSLLFISVVGWLLNRKPDWTKRARLGVYYIYV